MLKYFFQGLLLGLAYVAPLGMQNLYVINTALRGSRSIAFRTALITIFFDISLALSCFFGIGLLLKQSILIEKAVLLIGSVTVIYIGISLVKSDINLSKKVDVDSSIIKTAAACFAVTWLNPQAIIDGSLLLGGFKASLPVDFSKYFISGVCMASFLWFLSLSTAVSALKVKLSSRIFKWINVICGAVIILYGLKLGYSFLRSIYG